MYRLEVTGPAKEDIASAYQWWADNRSAEQAGRWMVAIDEFVLSLATSADRYGLATEKVLRQAGVQQASFGIGRRPTHRILYAVKGDAVVIYRVRALKQDHLALDDLD